MSFPVNCNFGGQLSTMHPTPKPCGSPYLGTVKYCPKIDLLGGQTVYVSCGLCSRTCVCASLMSGRELEGLRNARERQCRWLALCLTA